MRPSILLLAPAAFFVLVLVIVEGILHAHKRSGESEVKVAALSFAVELRMRAERELNGVLHLTSGLGSYFSVRKDSLEPDEIQEILRVVHGTSQYIRNFGVAVGHELTYVYPLEGNEEVLGLDYRSLARQWPDVERAIASRKAVLTDQINLLQGGQGFVYREPIYIDGEYWGLLSTVIDGAELLKAMFAEMGDRRYQFAVRGANNAELPLWGHPRLFDDNSTLKIESSHGWQFAVKPLQGELHSLPVFVLRVVGWILALIAAFGAYSALLHRRALTHMALHDSMTGLPNRLLLNDRMRQAIKRARSNRELASHSHVAVVFLDVDDFKAINDRFGHKAGDAVLKEVARRLESCARSGDTIARWAGDEFVMLIEQIGKDSIEPLLQRIDEAMAAPFFYEGALLSLKVSMGYTFAEREGETTANIIWEAGRCMYERKRMLQTVRFTSTSQA